jgi:hypothetical protein
MNSSEIRNILQCPYNRENWKILYRNIFQNKVTFHEIPYEYKIKEDIVESLYQIGYATLDDEYLVALFEVNIKNNVNLLSKKIGLRKIISKYISDDKFNGVLTIFENGSDDYRFTFASKTTKVTEEGVFVSETESKRFTYILGKNEPCITPSQRFESLLKKNGSIFIDDIVEAFSVDKLNKEFFNGYKEHYKLLCEFLYKSNYKKSIFRKDEKLIRDFVKKFLGRIVFLYFVQKKGWLGVAINQSWGTGDHQFLSKLFNLYPNKEKFYSKVLSKLFFDYLSINRSDDSIEIIKNVHIRIPYLNGGLFEKEDIDNSEIDFPSENINSLFTFFDRFNFTIYEDDPSEHTVAVDPEMLGHIFENLLEDNKDKGAYYTPKEIVHYMCQESLIEYLTTWFKNKGYKISGYKSFGNETELQLFSQNIGRKGQLEIEETTSKGNKSINRKLIEDLLNKKLSDDDKNLVLEHSKEFNKALDEVKICDIAIGSGAFPMGLLQEILITKQFIWNFENGNLIDFPSSTIKHNIIQNSIYGVDIEKGAVDIARLRFWLSLIVDEDSPKALPNLDYKIVVGNSLVSRLNNHFIDIDWDLNSSKYGLFNEKLVQDKSDIINKLYEEQKTFFDSKDKKSQTLKIQKLKTELIRNQISLMIETKGVKSSNSSQLSSSSTYKDSLKFTNELEELLSILSNSQENYEYFDWKLDFPEVFNSNINSNPGFDIIIGNPPYVSTKSVTDEDKKDFLTKYGFADDLYYHFIVKSISLLKKKGVLTMITPDTYFTTLTKKNLRESLVKLNLSSIVHLGHDIFESAMVSTSIFVLNNSLKPENNELKFIDSKNVKKLSKSKIYNISQDIFTNSINKSIFVPNETNLLIHNKFSKIQNELVNKYWPLISTSRDIEKNKVYLNDYRNGLKFGDLTLIGLVTDGGVGLQTGNNGKYVGVLEGSKESLRILSSREKKLDEFNKEYGVNYKLPKTEPEIWKLFDDLKEEYENDIFGQGYLYRIISKSQIADINNLSELEKVNGIEGNIDFVPYDKGDKDGNRWYSPTPFFIQWNKSNVNFLKSNSGKKGSGMPVVRNPQFYFKEGFCWNNNLNENYLSIKCRVKGSGVYDVASMSLFSLYDGIPDYYIVTLINSRYLGLIYRNFINNTVNVQMNDIRSFPIVVPTSNQLLVCKDFFEKSYKIQSDFFDNKISVSDRDKRLNEIQIEVDLFVESLYTHQTT